MGYRSALAGRDFRLLWTGMTISAVGDGLSWVAFVAVAYAHGGRPGDLTALAVAYTAPVVLGGLVAGSLLDRFDRRRLLIADNLVRACTMAALPILARAGDLRLWQVYAAAGVYGALRMFPLAGVPAIIPDLVADPDLDAANSLESLSFGIASMAGPALAGVALTLRPATDLFVLDALSYLGFAALLLPVRVPGSAGRSSGSLLLAGLVLVWRIRFLRANTLSFMAANAGEGVLLVVMPVYVHSQLGLGAEAFGLVAAAAAAGALVGSALPGLIRPRVALARAITIAQLAAAAAYLPLLALPGPAGAAACFSAGALLLAPLTIWAQVLRMRVIPAELRGRSFATIRVLIQATGPLGSLVAAPLIESARLSGASLAAVLLIGLPAAAGLAARDPAIA